MPVNREPDVGLANKLAESMNKKKKPPTYRLEPEVLLCPNVPKPMHGVAPREILGRKWWNKTRQAAYESTAFHCLACGVHRIQAKVYQWLEGHEMYGINYTAGRVTYLKTVPLCHFCHNYIHDGRLVALLEKGEMHQRRFIAIIQHGDKVLADAGLRRLTYKERENEMIDNLLNGEVARWKDWRLVLFGKEYPPKFKNERQWAKAFGR